MRLCFVRESFVTGLHVGESFVTGFECGVVSVLQLAVQRYYGSLCCGLNGAPVS